MKPGDRQSGSATTFDQARAAFEAAWRRILPTLSESNFEAYRTDRVARASVAAASRGETARSG